VQEIVGYVQSGTVSRVTVPGGSGRGAGAGAGGGGPGGGISGLHAGGGAGSAAGGGAAGGSSADQVLPGAAASGSGSAAASGSCVELALCKFRSRSFAESSRRTVDTVRVSTFSIIMLAKSRA